MNQVPRKSAATIPAIHLLDGGDRGLLLQWCHRLGVRPVEDAPPRDAVSLVFDPDGPGLLLPAAGKTVLRVDFSQGKLAHRLAQGANREALNKALGLTKNPGQRVVDATGGLGRDGFLIAAIGAELCLLERHPVLHGLLEHALQNISEHDELRPIGKRIQLIGGDAVAWLEQQAANSAEAVYLDPMFPARDKSALVKKDMQILHALLGETSEADNARLLAPALRVASKRVVVKRPRVAPYLAEQKPDHQQLGKSSRFDVYHCG